jgi:acetoin utilization deacetylase AcuC-like enzyme
LDKKMTGYVYDPLFLQHDWPGHPEHKGRLEAIYTYLQRKKVLEQMHTVPARPAKNDEMQLVHTAHYLDHITTWQDWLDGDTYMNAYSYQAATHAAGGLIDLALQVCRGNLENGIALLRPPGHHALPDRGMGFCILNNEAIAVRVLLEKKLVERIAIVDFDVHHGNGTQTVFYSDPSVLYISSHSYPFYPGTGRADETGYGRAVGTTLNIPLPAGSGDNTLREIYEAIVYPALSRFQPQFILVNAGYDAHRQDPLGNFAVTQQGFIDISTLILDAAKKLSRGKIVFSLNGGYNLDAISIAVDNAIKLLMNRSDLESEPDNRPA